MNLAINMNQSVLDQPTRLITNCGQGNSPFLLVQYYFPKFKYSFSHLFDRRKRTALLGSKTRSKEIYNSQKEKHLPPYSTCKISHSFSLFYQPFFTCKQLKAGPLKKILIASFVICDCLTYMCPYR